MLQICRELLVLPVGSRSFHLNSGVSLERTGPSLVVAKAAKKLGLQRTTLVEKMKKYGIERNAELR